MGTFAKPNQTQAVSMQDIVGHTLGLSHWNMENRSMGYGHAKTQWLSEWDLMAISTMWHSESRWGQDQESMRLALGVPEDSRLTRYKEGPNLLSDTADNTWF